MRDLDSVAVALCQQGGNRHHTGLNIRADEPAMSAAILQTYTASVEIKSMPLAAALVSVLLQNRP